MENKENLSVLVLAAGKGKRMKSSKPKVLHQIFEKPMLYYILRSAYELRPKNVIVVVGYKKDWVRRYLNEEFPLAKTVEQKQQLGTAHAVSSASKLRKNMGDTVVVLSGDCPLIKPKTLKLMVGKMIDTKSSATVLSTELSDPKGYGRIIKDDQGKVLKVVEEKDASPSQKKIKEVNTSIYSFCRDQLFFHVDRVGSDNSQNEYYLTDTIEKMVEAGDMVTSLKIKDYIQVLGVNDRSQMAEIEKILKSEINQNLMEAGVSISDPKNTHIQDTVTIDKDTVIEPYCFITGNTSIKTGCRIGPFCCIHDAGIGQDTIIYNSTIIGSQIADSNHIGPYCYMGPDRKTARDERIGPLMSKDLSKNKD